MNCKWGAAPRSGQVVRDSWEDGLLEVLWGAGALGPRIGAVGGMRPARRRVAWVAPDRPRVAAPLAREAAIRIGGAAWPSWLRSGSAAGRGGAWRG